MKVNSKGDRTMKMVRLGGKRGCKIERPERMSKLGVKLGKRKEENEIFKRSSPF